MCQAKRWSRSLMRGSYYRALTGKIFIEWSYLGGGRLREMVARGGSTLVLICEITKGALNAIHTVVS